LAICADFLSAYVLGITNSTDFIRDTSARRHYLSLCAEKLHSFKPEAIRELAAPFLSLCRATETFVRTSGNSNASTPSTNPVVFSQYSSKLARSGLDPEATLITTAAELLDAVEAGREGIGIALTYLFYELSRNPSLQRSLRAELATLSPRITYPVANPGDSQVHALPPPKAIDSLDLLNAIIQETFRVHHPTPTPQKRIVPPGGTIIDGYAIPGGVRISTSPPCLHMNERVYPEPLVFRPERWLSSQDNKLAKEEGTDELKEAKRWLWVFSNGGRMCVGSNLALQVFKLVVAAVYTNYTTTIVSHDGMEHRDDIIAGPVGEKLILQFHPVSLI